MVSDCAMGAMRWRRLDPVAFGLTGPRCFDLCRRPGGQLLSCLHPSGRPWRSISWAGPPLEHQLELEMTELSWDQLAAQPTAAVDALVELTEELAGEPWEVEPGGIASLEELVCEYWDWVTAVCPDWLGELSAGITVEPALSTGAVCIRCQSQVLLAAMFVRAQEYYECPADSIRRKVPFSLERYKAWCREVEPERGFCYYTRWPGFNLPGWVIDRLRAGELGPVRREEECLLKLLPPATTYVIAICAQEEKDSLQHELAHSLYATSPEYKTEVDSVLASLGPREWDRLGACLSQMGYATQEPHILWDEAQAYMIEGNPLGLGTARAPLVRRRLVQVFDKWLDALGIGAVQRPDPKSGADRTLAFKLFLECEFGINRLEPGPEKKQAVLRGSKLWKCMDAKAKQPWISKAACQQ